MPGILSLARRKKDRSMPGSNPLFGGLLLQPHTIQACKGNLAMTDRTSSLAKLSLTKGRLFALFAAITAVILGLPRLADGVTPAPDGGYANANTAEGTGALQSLTSGISNTAVGFGALIRNPTGSNNTALGFSALAFNTTGFENAATGWRSLFENTTGFHNTADGFGALFSNTTGNHNTAGGDVALAHNTTGNFNTASGAHALFSNTTGSSNVGVGFEAGFNITGSGNICIGEGILGVAGENNVTRVGNIGSTAQASGVFVTVGAGGKLGFQVSSRRYKEDIKPMDKASEALFALKPVSFHYKQEIDPARSADFGLIAEDVAIVNPDLVARDEEGKIITIRYQAVNAMLLNEFLKEHQKVEDQQRKLQQQESNAQAQEARLARQEAMIAQQQKQIEALSAGLHNVSNQLAVRKASLN
jgi:Chaperone of endosialidase